MSSPIDQEPIQIPFILQTIIKQLFLILDLIFFENTLGLSPQDGVLKVFQLFFCLKVFSENCSFSAFISLVGSSNLYHDIWK